MQSQVTHKELNSSWATLHGSMWGFALEIETAIAIDSDEVL